MTLVLEKEHEKNNMQVGQKSWLCNKQKSKTTRL
jgi:hypothetical protein